jgi:hypothetical protein
MLIYGRGWLSAVEKQVILVIVFNIWQRQSLARGNQFVNL